MKIGNISLIAPSHYPLEHWSEAEVLGSLMWLWQYVPNLKDAPLSYLMTRVIPFLQHRQFSLFIENDRIVGCVSWAYLNEETEEKYIENQGLPMLIDEWNSGDRLWIIDWFAPFGHSKMMSKIVVGELFPLVCMRSLYHRGKETGLKVKKFKGSQVALKDFQQWQNLLLTKNKF